MATLFRYPIPQGVTKATAKQQMLKQLICTNAPEQALRYHGYRVIAGVDEVGRGALFGPVVAAAVILPERIGVLARMGLKDSKQLTRDERERLDRKVRRMAVAVGIAEVDAETIDRINIYQASRMAMELAVARLGVSPDHLIIDAMRINHPCAQTKLYYGDALCLSIAAASVVAKVHRDALLRELDLVHPQYGLAQHKGYATPEHRKALREHGPCPLHRRSFAPVLAADPNADLDLALESGELFLDDDSFELEALEDLEPFPGGDASPSAEHGAEHGAEPSPEHGPEPRAEHGQQRARYGGHRLSLRLLCVVAHPDDECFAFGGALALAADRGVETFVICLTDGQAATHRGHAKSGQQLGEMRRAEFAASCKVLGVTQHELLDYHDAQLEFTDFSKLAGKLVERIRRFRPQVVLTFGGDGALNTHPDHTMVSAATTAAFHWAASPKRYPQLGEIFQPQRLYYLTTDFFLPDRKPPLPAPWTVTLDIRAVFERKQEAFRAHKSQAPLMERTKPIFEKHGGTERYALAAAPEPQPATQSTDLFAGVVE